MHEDVFRGRRRVALTSMVAAGAVIALAACGSGGGSGGSGGGATGGASTGNLPASITVVSTNPTTGVVAFAGSAANKGYDLAVKEINAQKFLGDTTLTLTKVDTKSTPATAAQVTTTAIADKSVSAIFGSVSSNEAVAQSPLVQKAGMPIIYTQAGSDGVVIGDYTYRATPLMREYYPIIKKFIDGQGLQVRRHHLHAGHPHAAEHRQPDPPGDRQGARDDGHRQRRRRRHDPGLQCADLADPQRQARRRLHPPRRRLQPDGDEAAAPGGLHR